MDNQLERLLNEIPPDLSSCCVTALFLF